MKNLLEKFKNYILNKYRTYCQTSNHRLKNNIFSIIFILVLAAGVTYFILAKSDKKLDYKPALSPDLIKQQPPTISDEAKIRQPNLDLSLYSSQGVIKLNDTVLFHVKYQNNETESIRNLKISFLPGNNKIRLSRISQLNSDKVRLDEQGNLSLDQLAVAEAGELNLLVRFERKEPELNQTVSLVSVAKYEVASSSLKKTTVSKSIKILAEPKVTATVYYYSPQGDQLGVGPLPPKVGFPTTFWIFWEIKNYGNDLTAFKVYGQLPSQVTLTGNKSLLAGELKYSKTNAVEWSVNQVNKESGVYKVGFEVELVPNTAQVGLSPNIATDLEYTTIDQFCDQPVQGALKNLSTNLVSDMNGKIQGRVVN